MNEKENGSIESFAENTFRRNHLAGADDAGIRLISIRLSTFCSFDADSPHLCAEKAKEVYAAYRKAGYSKAFLEAHQEEITLHKAAKVAFDEVGLQKLPKVKKLDAEFAELLTKKKAAYPDYRKARNEMQELVRAQKNVERFFAEEKPAQENEQAR